METQTLDGERCAGRLFEASGDGRESVDEWLRGGGAKVDGPKLRQVEE